MSFIDASSLDTLVISAGAASVATGGALILGWKRELRRPDHGWRQSAVYWMFLLVGVSLVAWRAPGAARRLAAYWQDNWAGQSPLFQFSALGLLALTGAFAVAGIGALRRRDELSAKRGGRRPVASSLAMDATFKALALAWSGEYRDYADKRLSRLVWVARVTSAIFGVILAGGLLLSLAGR